MRDATGRVSPRSLRPVRRYGHSVAGAQHAQQCRQRGSAALVGQLPLTGWARRGPVHGAEPKAAHGTADQHAVGVAADQHYGAAGRGSRGARAATARASAAGIRARKPRRPAHAARRAAGDIPFDGPARGPESEAEIGPDKAGGSTPSAGAPQHLLEHARGLACGARRRQRRGGRKARALPWTRSGPVGPRPADWGERRRLENSRHLPASPGRR